MLRGNIEKFKVAFNIWQNFLYCKLQWITRSFLGKLNFVPKENTAGIFVKKYPRAEAYSIEVNLEKQIINYGKLIKADSKTTQNFSMPENFVVLECVNRLLEKGYDFQNFLYL
jgi:type I restriction enzyme M protein